MSGHMMLAKMFQKAVQIKVQLYNKCIDLSVSLGNF